MNYVVYFEYVDGGAVDADDHGQAAVSVANAVQLKQSQHAIVCTPDGDRLYYVAVDRGTGARRLASMPSVACTTFNAINGFARVRHTNTEHPDLAAKHHAELHGPGDVMVVTGSGTEYRYAVTSKLTYVATRLK